MAEGETYAYPDLSADAPTDPPNGAHIGTVPGAFLSPTHGHVGLHVMCLGLATD